MGPTTLRPFLACPAFFVSDTIVIFSLQPIYPFLHGDTILFSSFNMVPLREVEMGKFFYLIRSDTVQPTLCLMGGVARDSGTEKAIYFVHDQKPGSAWMANISNYEPALAAVIDDANIKIDPGSFEESSLSVFGSPSPGHLVMLGNEAHIALSGATGDSANLISLKTGVCVYQTEIDNWASFSRWKLEIPKIISETIYESSETSAK